MRMFFMRDRKVHRCLGRQILETDERRSYDLTDDKSRSMIANYPRAWLDFRLFRLK